MKFVDDEVMGVDEYLVDMLMEVLFGKLLCMYCDVMCVNIECVLVDVIGIVLLVVVFDVLKYLMVGSKLFLIMIGDCLVGGMLVCD